MSAQVIAEATRIHQEHASRHAAAATKAKAISDRLQEVRSRMQAITNERVAGHATGAMADEFILLNSDSELLESMHREAQSQAAEIANDVNQAQRHIQDAQLQHGREQAEIEFYALSQRTKEIEAVFIRALAATAAAGRRIGHVGLSQSWQPSQPLQRAISYGVAPVVEQ